MYCPSCGTNNSNTEAIRFCRSCGVDLRAVSKAFKSSLPVRVATALDSYFENRFQQNLRNGVLNIVAFIFLLVVGIGHLISGWTGFGLVLLVLALISVVSGVWDIWIYKRNLPRVAKQPTVSLPQTGTEQVADATDGFAIASVTESTTKQLEMPERRIK